MNDTEYYCELGSVPLQNFFDFSFAPPLLLYAYLPIALIALVMGAVVFRQHRSLLNSNTLFFALAVMYVAYIVNEIAQWVVVPAPVVYFAWVMIVPLRMMMLVLLTWFVISFINQRNISRVERIVGASFLLPVFSLAPSILNIESFDLNLCEGIMGPLHYYLLVFEVVVISFISYISSLRMRNIQRSLHKTQIVLVCLGSISFVLLLSAVDQLSEFLGYSYDINLVSPIGMLAFLGAMTYMMVKFNTFNTKIFAAQALVVILWILIGSLLLVVKSETSRIIMVLTLTLSIAFGIALVRSVRREVDARQKLAEANEGQERFIHFLSHEVKGNLTVARNGFAAIGQGDLGPVSDEVSAVSRSALERLNDGVDTVENILRSANLKSGTMTFAFAPFDLAGALRTQVEIVRPLAEKKGLALAVEIPEGEYICVGDKQNITEHVLRNLLENAIHYTERGSVQVFLARAAERFVLRVVDTGIGISQEDRMKLFTQGGRGVDSLKHNVHSTGHGLFIAKSIVEAHNGRIRAVSEGKGRGTTFEVELPMRRR